MSSGEGLICKFTGELNGRVRLILRWLYQCPWFYCLRLLLMLGFFVCRSWSGVHTDA